MLDNRIRHALFVLIFKVDNHACFTQLCPINLCNVAYKIITKVLLNRLRPFLSEVVGLFQNSSLASKSATDNVIVA